MRNVFLFIVRGAERRVSFAVDCGFVRKKEVHMYEARTAAHHEALYFPLLFVSSCLPTHLSSVCIILILSSVSQGMDYESYEVEAVVAN